MIGKVGQDDEIPRQYTPKTIQKQGTVSNFIDELIEGLGPVGCICCGMFLGMMMVPVGIFMLNDLPWIVLFMPLIIVFGIYCFILINNI